MAYKLIDPVAQSFIIETPCVLTKVGLYFRGKDASGSIPAFIHIRKNVNGYPGPYVIPFSEKIVYASEITLSTATVLNENITAFDSPIFLAAGEYSLCVGSPSSDWQVAISRVGATDGPTGKKISLQPYVGSLFKSQNASTWTADQEADLTFKLYRAVFDTNTTADVDFTVRNDRNDKVLLSEDPLHMVTGSDLLRVYHYNHGMKDGDYVIISGIDGVTSLDGTATYNGVSFNNIVDTALPISNATHDSYTVTLPENSTGTSRFGGTLVHATRNVKIDAIYPVVSKIEHAGTRVTNQIKMTNLNGSLDSEYTTIPNDTVELSSARMIPSVPFYEYNMSKTGEYLTFRLSLSTDSKYISPIIDTKQLGLVVASNLLNNPTYASENNLPDFDETTILSSVSTTITQLDGAYGQIAIPSGQQAIAAAMTIGTQLTITGGSNAGSYRITDIEEDGSIVYVVNIAGTAITPETTSITVKNGDKYISEEAASGSTAVSKYITRQVDFVNPSTALNIRILTNRPQGSNILFYYKIKEIGDSSDLSNKEYTALPLMTTPIALNDSYDDVEYQVDGLPEFSSVVFKIVFTSNDSTKVPKCKDLRLIALA